MVSLRRMARPRAVRWRRALLLALFWLGVAAHAHAAGPDLAVTVRDARAALEAGDPDAALATARAAKGFTDGDLRADPLKGELAALWAYAAARTGSGEDVEAAGKLKAAARDVLPKGSELRAAIELLDLEAEAATLNDEVVEAVNDQFLASLGKADTDKPAALPPPLAARQAALRARLLAFAARAPPVLAGEARLAVGYMAYSADDHDAALARAAEVERAATGSPRKALLAVAAASLRLSVANYLGDLKAARAAYARGREAGRGRDGHPQMFALHLLAAEAFGGEGAREDTLAAVEAVLACQGRNCRPALASDDFTLAQALARVGALDQARSLAEAGLDLTASAGGDLGAAATWLVNVAFDDAPASFQRAFLEDLLLGARPRISDADPQRPDLMAALGKRYGAAQVAIRLSAVTPLLEAPLRDEIARRLAEHGPAPDAARLAAARRAVPGDHAVEPPYDDNALSPAAVPVLAALEQITTALTGAGRKADAQAVYQAYVDATLSDPARDHAEAGRVVSFYRDFLKGLGAQEEASAQDILEERERARSYAQAARAMLAAGRPSDSTTIPVALEALRRTGLREELGRLAGEAQASIVERFDAEAATYDLRREAQAVVGGLWASGRVAEGSRLADRFLAVTPDSGLDGFRAATVADLAGRHNVADAAAGAAAIVAIARDGRSDVLCARVRAAFPLAFARTACAGGPALPVQVAAAAAPSVDSERLVAELDALTAKRARELAQRPSSTIALADVDLQRADLLSRLGRTDDSWGVATEAIGGLVAANLRDTPVMTRALVMVARTAAPGRRPDVDRLLAEQAAGLAPEATGARALLRATQAFRRLQGRTPDLEAVLADLGAAFETPAYWASAPPAELAATRLLSAVVESAAALPEPRMATSAPAAARLAALLGGSGTSNTAEDRYLATTLALLGSRARGDGPGSERLIARMRTESFADTTSLVRFSQERLEAELARAARARADLAKLSAAPPADLETWSRTYRAAMEAGDFARASLLVRQFASRSETEVIWTSEGSEPLIGAALQFAEGCRPPLPVLEARLARDGGACRREALSLLELGLAQAAMNPRPQSNRRLADVAGFARLMNGDVAAAQMAAAFRLAAEAEILNPTDPRRTARAIPAFGTAAPDPDRARILARDVGGAPKARQALAALRQTLAEDEALVVLDMTGALVVRRAGVGVTPLVADEEEVRNLLRRLRSDLDPVGAGGADPGYDVAAAFRLWSLLFAPLAGDLEGVRRLRIAPFGVLAQTPLEALVTAAPAAPRWSPTDPADPAWAVRTYAFTIMPSLERQARMAAAPRSTAPLALLGLGGPNLTGGGRAVRSVEGLLDASGAVDPDRVRGLTPLSATVDELNAMRDLVGAAQARLVTGEALREDPVRTLAWRQYRVVAFATHGLVAAGEAAPGQVLVLTPPPARTATDDGVLSSAEIRALQLDADLVILSACDTGAAPEGMDATGSFADAFMAAGARTVVVSRWPLLSETAALLTTPLVREAADHGPGGVTAAQRHAILALLGDPPRPNLRHPMFWAAFSVVGDAAPRVNR